MKTHTIYDKDGNWIKITRVGKCQYEVVDDSVTEGSGHDCRNTLVFSEWRSKSCKNLDGNPDVALFGGSIRLQVGKHIELSTEWVTKAPSVWQLRKVFRTLQIDAVRWDDV